MSNLNHRAPIDSTGLPADGAQEEENDLANELAPLLHTEEEPNTTSNTDRIKPTPGTGIGFDPPAPPAPNGK